MKYIYVFFKFKPFDLANSIWKMFTFHCDKIIPKYYIQSEFTVRYIHLVVSRVRAPIHERLS